MKPLFLLILSAALLGSCKKSGDKKASDLVGKWRLVETSVSTDGPVGWSRVNSSDYVQFHADGKFSSNSLASKYDRYKIADNSLIEFSKSIDPQDIDEYLYKFEGARLIISGTYCLEDCAYKYKPATSDF